MLKKKQLMWFIGIYTVSLITMLIFSGLLHWVVAVLKVH